MSAAPDHIADKPAAKLAPAAAPKSAELPGGPAPLQPFSSYQKFVVAMLAFLQFTVILDFMMLSPLGALLMPALQITPQQFGLVVSIYAFSAGISGLLAAGFADRFDRKKMLLVFYSGFIGGTLLCGLANTYPLLLGARMVTGIFGGVLGSIVFAITTDLFPMQMRGRVMGVVQTAFAASQVLGIPVGLYLSNRWDWHMPFFMIVGVGSLVGVVIWFKLQPINDHLKLRAERSAYAHMRSTVTNPRYLQGFATTALMSTGGFMLMPFASAFTVHNLGISLEQLPMVYMITGFCAIFAGPLIGRAADAIGKYRVFVAGSLLSIVMVLIYTNLGVTPLAQLVAVNAIMFVGISSRMISSQALMSAVPSPSARGSYMAISSAIQQMSGGLASVAAGYIIVEGAGGTLERFNVLGYVVVASSVVTMAMMFFINRMVAASPGR